MPAAIKSSLIIGISVSAIVGAVIAHKYFSKLGLKQEIFPESLSSDVSKNPDYALSYNWWDFLVSADKDNNKDWWEESYRFWKQHKPTNSKFENISEGYSSKNPKSLNQVCHEAYKSKDWDFSKGNGDSDPNRYDWRDIFKYCSPLRGIPNAFHQDLYKEGTIGHMIGIKDTTFAVDVDTNDKFWEIKNNIFKSQDLKSSTSEFWKNQKASNMHIKNICKEVYLYKMQDSIDTSDPTLLEANKFCRW